MEYKKSINYSLINLKKWLNIFIMKLYSSHKIEKAKNAHKPLQHTPRKIKIITTSLYPTIEDRNL
jgi:hypothetical protein